MATGLMLLSLGAILASGSIDTQATNQQVADKANGFGSELYRQVGGNETGNLFLSPYSINNALALTLLGAKGETAAQMAKVMHVEGDLARYAPEYSSLIKAINGLGLPRDYQLSVANSIWSQAGLRIQPEFAKAAREYYGAGIREVDFRRAAELARKGINQWVENRTQDKIKDLLKPLDLSSATSMVLVNAIYFKAAWDSPFLEQNTKKDGEFEIGPGQKITVPVMQKTHELAYFGNDAMQVLELPYEGKSVSMIVLLPRQRDGLASLEKSLASDSLSAALSQLRPKRVAVALPRFKMSSRFELGNALRGMGMTLPFESGVADFSGITTQEKLAISKVIHQAVVEVNEEGTVAAAATAVTMMRASAPSKPESFRADHPFIFLIRDNQTGCFLFMGRVANPAS